MKIAISEIRLANSTQIRIAKQVNDKEVAFFVGRFEKHTDYKTASIHLAIEQDVLIDCVTCFHAANRQPYSRNLYCNVPPLPVFQVRVEGSNADTNLQVASIELALSNSENKLILWEDTYHVCCLDVDFPSDATPSSFQLANFCELVTPSPLAYFISKSGGAHLFYIAVDNLTADELAAVGAFHLLRRFPQAQFEFLHRSRGSENIHYRTPTTDVGIIRGLLLDGNETDNEAYLESRSIKAGMRLAHTECPVNPSKRATGNSNPVIVYDDHYFCYICNKDGRRCGAKEPGYFPFAAISGSRVNTQIHRCVTNFVHWTHAKHIFAPIIRDLQFARLIYSTLLKLQYNQDPRIPLVFTCGEPNGLVRHNGYWCDAMGNALVLAKGSGILASLPHCMELGRNHGIVVNHVASEWMQQAIDLTIRGYPPVTPLHGIQFTAFQQLPETKVYTVLPTKGLSDAKQPRYIAQSDRMPEEECWLQFASIFPGIDKNLIHLLLAGRGCVEHHAGLPPMLFLTGPTGSGKTGHVEIAAAIAGDNCTPIKLSPDRDRFDNALCSARDSGAFVFLDEFFKNKGSKTDVEAMETLLTITPNTRVYRIYIGAIPMGDLPFLIWADTVIPEEVKAHEQIGRRVHHYDLSDELAWEKPMMDAGIGKPKDLRLNGSDEVILACNSILSYIIDLWFMQPVTDFASVAEFLQIARIRDSNVIEDKRDSIRELYTLWLKAKPITEAPLLKRFSKPGFRIAKDDGHCLMYQALHSCQTEAEQGTDRCRAIDESDLRKVLGTKLQTKMETRKHGTIYAIRFTDRCS